MTLKPSAARRGCRGLLSRRHTKRTKFNRISFVEFGPFFTVERLSARQAIFSPCGPAFPPLQIIPSILYYDNFSFRFAKAIPRSSSS